jgi:hypothetical protein
MRDMRAVGRAVPVVALALCLALGATGCTFYFLPGGRPAPRSAYADHLGSITPEAAARLQSEAQASHGFTGEGPLTVAGSGDLKGTALHHSATFEWPILVGPIRSWWFLEPGPAGSSSVPGIVGHARGWGLLAPFLLAWGCDRSYDASTGLEVAREDIATAAFGLFVYHRATSPARKWLTYRDPARPGVGPYAAPDVRGGPEGVRYRHVSALALGWGAFAVGTKDRRAYLQIAWIPIPLWRMSK